MKSDYSKWLDAGKIATFFRIPVMVYLVFLIWVIKPSVVLFFFCFAVLQSSGHLWIHPDCLAAAHPSLVAWEQCLRTSLVVSKIL